MEQGQDGIDRLSKGQKDCLRLVLAHKTSKEIAQCLGVSPHTVDQRIRYAIRTMGVRSRSEAALALYIEETSGEGLRIPGIDTQDASSPSMRHVSADTHWYQRNVHQSPDLHAAAAAEALRDGRVFEGCETGYRPADPGVLRELYSAELGNRRSQSSYEEPVSLGAFPGGESYRERFLGGGLIGWGRKLMLVILIALMSIMAAGSLLTGLEALSDFLG